MACDIVCGTTVAASAGLNVAAIALAAAFDFTDLVFGFTILLSCLPMMRLLPFSHDLVIRGTLILCGLLPSPARLTKRPLIRGRLSASFLRQSYLIFFCQMRRLRLM